LITRYGERNIIGWGVAIYIVTIAIALTGQAIMHYTVALILLGLGWNFMFVGGTTLLIKTYQPGERFKAQAINEAAVFGTSAVGSLLAGALLSQFGWTLVVISTVPALLLVTALLVLTPTLAARTQK
jgi:MFS family permease